VVQGWEKGGQGAQAGRRTDGAGAQHGGRTDHRTKLMEVTKFGDDDYNDYQLTMPTAQVLYMWFVCSRKYDCSL
jgi:hypothetical protein